MKPIEERFNLDAEEQVLGCFFLDNGLLKETPLPADAFSEGPRRSLYLTMLDMERKGIPVDPFTIAQRIGMNNLHKVGGVSAMAEISSAVVNTKNFEYYAQLMLEKYREQGNSQIGKQLEHGMDPEAAIKELRRLQEIGRQKKKRTIKDILVDSYDRLESADGTIKGVKTRFRDLDKMLMGIKGGQLVIVGARPSVGKTAFAINIGLNAAEGPENLNGAEVEIFTYEMSDSQLSDRMIGAVGNIDLTLMKTAQRDFQPSDWTKLTHAMGTIGSSAIGITEAAGMGTADIRSYARQKRDEQPEKEVLIIIDYLQLISGDPRLANNRQQQVSDISRELKLIALEFNVAIIALSQLSRDLEKRQDKRPIMSDLRESGSIEQDADIIAFLYRDDYYDSETEDRNVIEIIVAKHRDGPTGTVKMAFIKEYGKFVSIDWDAATAVE